MNLLAFLAGLSASLLTDALLIKSTYIQIPDEITELEFNINNDLLKTVSDKDSFSIITIVESKTAAMGIQLKTDLLLQTDLQKFNYFLNTYLFYSKEGKKRALKTDETTVDIDTNKGSLKMTIPIAF